MGIENPVEQSTSKYLRVMKSNDVEVRARTWHLLKNDTDFG